MRRRAASSSLTFFLLQPAALAVENAPTTIKRQLMAAYGDPAVRPGWSREAEVSSTCALSSTVSPDSVQAQVVVSKFLPLKEADSSWDLYGFLRLWWFDPRLAFNSSVVDADGRCREVEFLEFTGRDRQLLWTPDIYVENAIEFERGVSGPATNGLTQRLRVFPDGTVFSSQQTRFWQTCNMNFDDAPFDTQRCSLKLGLFSTPEDQVMLHWKPEVEPMENVVSKNNCLSKWVVTAVESRNVTVGYPSGTWTMVEASVSFTRLPSELIGNYFLPAFIFVFLSCAY